MKEAGRTPGAKKLWKSIVGSAVTAITVIGGLFGAYEFLQRYSRYDLSGEWIVTNTIQSTSYRPFQGLKLGYTVLLTQHGTDLTGTGEKESEDGKDLPSGGHSHIQITGQITGFIIGKEITATFVEEGIRRKSEGTFHWSYQPKTSSLSGTFTSSAADASGSSIAQRAVPSR